VINALVHRLVDLIDGVEIRRAWHVASLRGLSCARKRDVIRRGFTWRPSTALMAETGRAFAMIFATAANVIPLLVSAAPAAPKELADTAIIHPIFWADRPFRRVSRKFVACAIARRWCGAPTASRCLIQNSENRWAAGGATRRFIDLQVSLESNARVKRQRRRFPSV
jgi:hypothetical protein